MGNTTLLLKNNLMKSMLMNNGCSVLKFIKKI